MEDVYYIQACCWSQIKNFSAAITILDAAYVCLPKTTSNFVRLYGYICTKLDPPRLESAIDSFSEVIKRNSQDLDAYLERASCYCCLQDYSLAIKDLNRVLAFRPDHFEARLRRLV
jgi:tetratricopeptide (TPR) repeat protein